MTNNKEKFITLKEAAKISGYAPDYIGQLIRKGKLPGKQIYNAVAWVTTEKVLMEYLENNQKRKKKLFKDNFKAKFNQLKNAFIFDNQLKGFLKVILYAAIIFSLGFSLILFYVFSVGFEKKLEQSAIEKVKAGAININSIRSAEQ